MVEKYQKNTNDSEDAKILYTMYMKFLDAESLRMEAMVKVSENHMAMSLELSQKAKQLLTSLQKESTSVYLSKRVDESLHLIKKGLLF
jgi:hypothetical protein